MSQTHTLYVLADPGKYCPGCVEVVGLVHLYDLADHVSIVEEPDWENRKITARQFGKNPNAKRWPLPIVELSPEYKPPETIRKLIQTAPNGQQVLIEEKSIAQFFHEEYGIPERA